MHTIPYTTLIQTIPLSSLLLCVLLSLHVYPLHVYIIIIATMVKNVYTVHITYFISLFLLLLNGIIIEFDENTGDPLLSVLITRANALEAQLR